MLILALVACKSDPDKLLDEVDVDPVEFEDEAPADGESVVYELDPTDPVLLFTAWGMGNTEQHGTWSEYNVRVVRKGDGLDDLTIDVLVNMDSVETNFDSLTNHLKTDDFFHTEAHPEAMFASTAVEPDGDAVTVTGDMTLRGTTKSISWTGTISEDGDALQAAAQIEFSRFAFGLINDKHDQPGADGVDDRVLLDYDVRLLPVE